MKEPKRSINSIDAPESDYLYIELSQLPSAGKGLHTAINIYKEEIISLFRGEILTNIQAKNRARIGKDKYFINHTDGSIIDSMKVKCFAKYANDATAFKGSLFKNNAKITMDEQNNICLVAVRNIKAGEEIFCSYGKLYWKKHG